MTNQPMTYSEACRKAATDQGLDPISEALTAAGIPFVIEQTGGMTMVLYTPSRVDPGAFGVTFDGDGFLVIYYDDLADDDEGDIRLESGTAADVVRLVSAPTPDLITCDECEWSEPSTGDRVTDSMLRAAHYGETHTTDRDMRSARRLAANPDAWRDS